MNHPDAYSPHKNSSPARDWLLAILSSLGVALAIVAPFFWLANPSGHDIAFHASSWLDVAAQWKEGILFPRWTEWANYGYGEPRFIFYPPISWILGGALIALVPIKAVVGAYVVLAQTLAGTSAYALVRRFASHGAALAGAACFAANPDALLIIYVRSDYAELLAIAFYPLLILAALQLCGLLAEQETSGVKYVICFALSFAAVWLTNAPAAVIASYSAVLLLAWASVTQKSWKPAVRGAAGIALGFGWPRSIGFQRLTSSAGSTSPRRSRRAWLREKIFSSQPLRMPITTTLTAWRRPWRSLRCSSSVCLRGGQGKTSGPQRN